MQTKTVAFDFDGVLVLDSENYKKEAWGKALAPYTGHYEPYLNEAVRLYGSGKPGGRKEILSYIFTKLGVGEAEFDRTVEEAAKVFDDYVQSMIMAAGLVPEAKPMLKKLRKRDIPLYLNSGTATSALMRSAQNLKIMHFFAAVLGSTPEPVGGSKVKNLGFVAKCERAEPAQILMVGDSDFDLNAAKEFGSRFIGVANRHNHWADTPQEFDFVTDLRNVLQFV